MEIFNSKISQSVQSDSNTYRLEAMEQKYNSVINHADIMVFECDLIKNTIKITSNLSDHIMCASGITIDLNDFMESDFVYENDKSIFKSVPEKLRNAKATFAVLRILNDFGQYFTCEVYFYGVYTSDGILTEIVGSAKTIEKANISYGSETDKRTGLMTDERFYRTVDDILYNDASKNYAMIIFESTSIKYANHLYGAKFGENVLKFIAYSLRTSDICSGIISYIAGGCFALFTSYENDLDLLRIVDKIKSRIKSYRHIQLKYSFGICRADCKHASALILRDCAGIAKESVKGKHMNNVAFYSENMNERMLDEIAMENDMEEALQTGQFEVYLQPKVDIGSDRIVGSEALVRWNHPQKGLIRPDLFIPLFERNGFITILDTYVWEKVCRTIRKWLDLGIEPAPVSVNVSRVNVSNPLIVETLNGLVEQYGIDKKYIELEITESVYYDDQISLKNVLSRLKKEGYTLLMDDFGSGFSSLNMLENTPFDVMKIDRLFLKETMITDKGKKIINHMISLSQDIGISVIAEGVETKEQAEFLLECGCRSAQGYYYSKPIPLTVFERMAGYAKAC